MRWNIRGERSLYESEWMQLRLVDVEIPGGRRFEHHVMRFPRTAAGIVIGNSNDGVLLLWRHRFITDTWGWEIPAGGVEPGENPADAARREAVEEAGYEPEDVERLTHYHPSNGSSDQTFHLFHSQSARHIGDPTDPSESERIEWLPVARLHAEIEAGRVTDGLSLTALLWATTFGFLR